MLPLSSQTPINMQQSIDYDVFDEFLIICISDDEIWSLGFLDFFCIKLKFRIEAKRF